MKEESIVTAADIRAAFDRIREHVRKTPGLWLTRGALGIATPVALKLEYMQYAGSFKPRGAFNTLLSALESPATRTAVERTAASPISGAPGYARLPAGIAAASGGNHGAAVAYAARALGQSARIFIPEIASAAKVAAIRAFGADVVIGGARYADAQEACDRFVAESGALRIHPFDSEETIAGQGTVALEWEAQTKDGDAFALDTVLVASGGGGLVAGMAVYWHPRVKVVAVEPEGSRALHAALEANAPVDVRVESVAADSLGARNVGPRVYRIAKETGLSVTLVRDDAITDAQHALWRDFRIAVEPGGAAAAAALRSGAYVPKSGERVGVLVCGANVVLDTLAPRA